MLGILTIIATTILIIFLFTEAIKIKNAQVLKWLPLLLCFIGFYLAGLVNRKTKLALTPFLLISLVVFIPLELLYFPFLFLIIFFSLLSILVYRTDLCNEAKTRSNYQFSGIPYHIIVDSKGNYKECPGPYFIDKELLNNQDEVTEYINTPYKVFKTIKANGKKTVVKVR